MSIDECVSWCWVVDEEEVQVGAESGREVQFVLERPQERLWWSVLSRAFPSQQAVILAGTPRTRNTKRSPSPSTAFLLPFS